MHFSGWVFSLIFLGILVLITAAFLIYYFRDYIGIYKTPRIMILIGVPIVIFGEYNLWNLVIANINGQMMIQWPQPSTIVMIIVYGILIGIFCTFATVFGDTWIMSLQFRKIHFLGPYLVFGADPHTSIRIGWISKKSINPIQCIKIQPQPKSYKINSRAFNSHIHNTHIHVNWVEITDLEAGNTYQYRFTNPDFPQQLYYFTLPARIKTDKSERFSFTVVGDLHAGEHRIQKYLNSLQAYYANDSFWLTLGDIITEAQDPLQWRAYFIQAAEILSFMPIFYTIGNHEGFSPLRIQNWRTYFWPPYANETQGCYYSSNVKNTHFVFLDNYDNRAHFYHLSGAQIQWLYEDLEKAQVDDQYEHIIIYMHHPPFSAGDAGCDPVLGQIFHDITEKYSKIRFILAGHCHFYQSFIVPRKKDVNSRVAYVISGGGAKRMEDQVTKKYRIHYRPYNWSSDGIKSPVSFSSSSQKPDPLRNDQFIHYNHHKSMIIPHFLHFTVENHVITMQVLDWNNNEIDRVIIKK